MPTAPEPETGTSIIVAVHENPALVLIDQLLAVGARVTPTLPPAPGRLTVPERAAALGARNLSPWTYIDREDGA